MTIRVSYFGQLKQAAGVAGECLVLDREACSILELLALLADRHGDPLRPNLLGADGKPRPGLLFVVNDDAARGPDACPLRDGDAVTLLSPIAGG